MPQTRPAACVIGWPVAHSRSPLIHRYWLQEHGIAGDYRREAVAPEALADFLGSLAARGYVGANVTLPHKEAALTLSQPDAVAHAVGAANTLWLEGGVLRATNTDVEGFLAALDAAAPGWDKGLGEAVVIGAGGAARGVVHGLLQRRLGRIHVVNRTLARAEALAQRFGGAVAPTPWQGLEAALAGAGLLVNASSLGMEGYPPLALDLSPLKDEVVVADIVYTPLRTGLLAAAAARGLATCDGLAMLLHQAVRGFELWFGVRPTVTPALRTLIETDLCSHGQGCRHMQGPAA